MRVVNASFAVMSAVLFSSAATLNAEPEFPVPPEQGCTFRADPAAFLHALGRARESVHRRLNDFSAGTSAAVSTVAEAPLVRRNFIDHYILGKLEQLQVKPARLSSDEEFVRRVFLDIIGRIPSAAEVKAFVADTAIDKRTRLVEALLVAPEFNDKWSVWFEDLVGMTETLSTSNRRPQVEGRNAFDGWLREKMSHNTSIKAIVTSMLTGTGNNYYFENGPANFMVAASTAMGPIQDTYDMMLVKSTNAFLGLGHYDCLLCHNGRGHLDQLSLWAGKRTRSDAHRMAAHFSRTRLSAVPNTQQYESPLYASTEVTDNPTGNYALNTTSGNRPSRTPYGTERSVSPEYRDSTPTTGNWRAAFAEKLTRDPMFGINFVNRIWKEFFGLALADPVDALDPARLDPDNPPPAPWTLQASHPELLRDLAKSFVANDTNLREFIKLIALSTSYQLSSRYDGEWKFSYVPLFARHYPRRLWAEEVHDAIVKATGVMPQYSWLLVNSQTVARGTPTNSLPRSEPVAWAMKVPDITEPRFINNTVNNGATSFLSTFLRGNRDTARRSGNGSILQQLKLMNDNAVVLPKIKVANSPTLSEIAKTPNAGDVVDELWLTFLSRRPTTAERARAVEHLAKAQPRNAAIEDLAWVAINKVEFLFSH